MKEVGFKPGVKERCVQSGTYVFTYHICMHEFGHIGIVQYLRKLCPVS